MLFTQMIWKKISYSEGKNLCKEKNALIFNEISAKNGVGVKELFPWLKKSMICKEMRVDKLNQNIKIYLNMY